MAKEELRSIGGKTTIRFEGPNFRPKEIARALNALQSTLERAAQLELRGAHDVGVVKPPRRLEVVVTRLTVADSWEVAALYAWPAAHLAFQAIQAGPQLSALWVRIAGRIGRTFRRLGRAHGWEVDVAAEHGAIREELDRDEREDPRFADSVERILRTALETAESAVIEVMDGAVRISIRYGGERSQ